MDDAATAERKRLVRVDMRARRKSLIDRPARSQRIATKLAAHDAVVGARSVMAYTTMGSEVDTNPFIEWCSAHDVLVRMPEDDVEPTWPDVVIVPGLAFTETGQRCGQGGGWYDRFLPRTRSDCTTIGVCFDVQIVDDVPVGPHDVVLDAVITD